MDNSKQSNKISDIVKLKRMLKKWRIQASSANASTSTNDSNSGSAASNNSSKKGSLSRSNSNNNSSKKGSLSRSNSNNNISNSNKKGSLSRSNSRKGITFLKRTLSFTDLSSTGQSSNAVPKGFLAVHVGEEMKRYVLPTKYLGHQAFSTLLKEAEEEFGFQQEGVLRIPCEVEVFENILGMVDAKNSPHAKQALKYSRIDGIVCGTVESQSISKAHHPPSPMCR